MGKKGVSAVEILMWLVGGFIAVLGYVHATFATYREVIPRLERIESLVLELRNNR